MARRAEITQAYILRMFGTKKALFLEVTVGAFDRTTEGMRDAAGSESELDALSRMGAQYNEMLADRTSVLLQLQGFTACGDAEVRDPLAPRGGWLGMPVDYVVPNCFSYVRRSTPVVVGVQSMSRRRSG